jgi:D-alanine-D-alanine ligase
LIEFLDGLRQEYGDELFVFNVAEYLDEAHKAGFLPELLDAWQAPHLGSSALVAAVGLDKERTKARLRQHDIPTPRSFVARQGERDIEARAEAIGYPLIVKPLREGGHIGIGEDSIVYDPIGLDNAVHRIFNQQRQPALVEDFINGKAMREFSVGIIDGETQLFTPVEIDYEAMGVVVPILSYEVAEQDQERIKPVADAGLRELLNRLTARTFEVVGARDYSRVDLRMDASGCYVLEINTMPGLGPHSFLPEAAQFIHGLGYPQLIQRLAEVSLQRYA